MSASNRWWLDRSRYEAECAAFDGALPPDSDVYEAVVRHWAESAEWAPRSGPRSEYLWPVAPISKEIQGYLDWMGDLGKPVDCGISADLLGSPMKTSADVKREMIEAMNEGAKAMRAVPRLAYPHGLRLSGSTLEALRRALPGEPPSDQALAAAYALSISTSPMPIYRDDMVPDGMFVPEPPPFKREFLGQWVPPEQPPPVEYEYRPEPDRWTVPFGAMIGVDFGYCDASETDPDAFTMTPERLRRWQMARKRLRKSRHRS